jgi:hypothetical protein
LPGTVSSTICSVRSFAPVPAFASYADLRSDEQEILREEWQDGSREDHGNRIIQLPAGFLLSGLFMRRGRNEPIGLFDLGSLVVVLLCVGYLVRRMYISPLHSLAGMGRGFRLPTVATPSGPVEEPGLGSGFVIVSGLLILVRVYCRIRHRDAPSTGIRGPGSY